MRIITTICLMIWATSSFAQTSWITQPYNYEWKRGIFDSTLRVPVISSNRAFFANKDSIGQTWINSDSIKLFIRFPGNLIKSIVTYDTILALKNQFNAGAIQNQIISAQTGNYYISGQGSNSKSIIYQPASVPFVQYLNFSHDGIDTTKKSWSFGVSGTPAGSPFHTGDSLTLRSYSTTGTFVRDVMVFYRSGTVRFPGTNQLILGNTGGSANELTVNGISVFNGTMQMNGTITHTAGIVRTGTTTVTGDYSTLSTDLFINVNNTNNCTITLPATPIGSILHIKKTINNAFTVTIVSSGGGPVIDGGASVVLSAFNDKVMIHDDGTNYYTY